MRIDEDHHCRAEQQAAKCLYRVIRSARYESELARARSIGVEEDRERGPRSADAKVFLRKLQSPREHGWNRKCLTVSRRESDRPPGPPPVGLTPRPRGDILTASDKIALDAIPLSSIH